MGQTKFTNHFLNGDLSITHEHKRDPQGLGKIPEKISIDLSLYNFDHGNVQPAVARDLTCHAWLATMAYF